MKDEIQSGIKNAIERGASLEEAVQTFINAGYNPVEVREAANTIANTATSMVEKPRSVKSQPAPQIMLSQPPQSQQQAQQLSQTQQPTQLTSSSSPIQQPPFQAFAKPNPSFPIPAQPFLSSPPPPKHSKTKVIILIIVLVLLLGSLGAIMWFYGKDLLAFVKGSS